MGVSREGRSKRTGWTTPRDVLVATTVEDGTGDQLHALDEVAESVEVFQQPPQQQQQCHDPELQGMVTAVAILEAIVRAHAVQSEPMRRRRLLLEQIDSLRVSDVTEHEREQLAYFEHMHATVALLQRTLETERRTSQQTSPTPPTTTSSCELNVATGAAETTPHRYDYHHPHIRTKRPEVPARLLHSPLRGRLSSGPTVAQESAVADLENALEKSANVRMRARVAETRAFESEWREQQELAQRSEWLASGREHKLREALVEKAHWKHAYTAMREQVMEEKTRQAELFQHLETAKSDSRRRTDELERALRECFLEVELLRSQLAESHVTSAQTTRAMVELAKSAKDEKDRLVCTIAETRHKFKEWKEGEASTLKAARDQAVHTLKTEYELKIARHHNEKQKLRDKVKDLEVSLRLLQTDRNLSPAELSRRKATILGSNDDGATTEAELVEANCRIKELEALLTHAKEYQKRQEHILRAAEATVTHMMQEREVVALENLVQAGSLSLRKAIDPIDVVSVARGTSSPSDPNLRPSTVAGVTHTTSRKRSTSDSPSAQMRRPSASIATRYVLTGESTQNSSSSAADPEKEMMRRQSIVLSAEVEKYRQLVVHSVDEIRVLKDSRRRSHHSMAVGSTNGTVTTLKEQYLMGEVIRLQGELEALKKTKTQKKREVRKAKETVVGTEAAAAAAEGSSDDESSSFSHSNSNSSDSESDAEHLRSESKKTKPQKEPPRVDSTATHVSFMNEKQEERDDSDDREDQGPRQELQDEMRAPTAPAFQPAAIADLTPMPATPVRPGDAETEATATEAAVKRIQHQSKAFLLRRDFIKQKLAISKIKARYRGYLVRKNVELLDRHHQHHLVVSQAVQFKMAIVDAHHEMTCKCYGLQLRLVIRVSKNPPIVEIRMTPVRPEQTAADTNDASALDEVRVAYFHLFEIVALLPTDEEAAILDKASEQAIAETFASLLSVVRVGGSYKFAIKRRQQQPHESEKGANPHEHSVHFGVFPAGGSALSELPVEKMPATSATRSLSADADAAADARELEELIRTARVPLADSAVGIDADSIHADMASRADHAHLTKFLRRLSTSSLDVIPETRTTAERSSLRS